MTTTPTISNQKIIFFVVFICAALMSSLFIYHATQQRTSSVIASDVGFIFPAPRDIKSFNLMATNHQPFTLNNLRGHWTLLFFGFTHCSSICPTNLDVLNRVYTHLQPHYPQLQVALMSVDPDRDTLSSLKSYVEQYNPAFLGVTGKLAEIRKLQSQLGIYASPDSPTNGSYQIQHTSSILLINPKGQWAGTFNYGVKMEKMIEGIRVGIESAEHS